MSQKRPKREPKGLKREAKGNQRAAKMHPEVVFWTRSRKVLIVDDNEINHEVLKGVFEDFDLQLLHAYNGYECLNITEKEFPDIILMDFHMPDIDGTEVTKQLKNSSVTSSIPVLGVSADAFKSSKIQALESGMVGYVTKPIDFNLLFRF